MNYSFILNDANKIDMEKLSEAIKVEVTGNVAKENYKENITFDKNIIKLSDGDALAKIIVGKALKNNKDIKDNESKEVEFAKKYQILSKNTALFAEILNENPSENKLIKVNLVENQNQNRIRFGMPVFKNMAFGGARMMAKCCAAPMPTLCCNAAPTMSRPMKSMAFAAPKKMMKMAAPKHMVDNMMININSAPKIEKKIMKEKECAKPNMSKSDKNELTKLIMEQDIMEGSWKENEETKKLLAIIPKEKIDAITKKVKEMKKNNQENKIIYTLFVLYYLVTKQTDKLNDFRLVINKANKYLASNGIDYEKFFKEI